MTVHNKKYIFSGHESFPCKTLWLKKGYDFVVQGKDFNNPNSVIDLGVGKNMVASIRFWLRAFNVCKEGKPTWLGDYLFEEVYGKDRYIEDLATLWLLHWYIAYKSGMLYNLEIQDVFTKFSYETRISSSDFCKSFTLIIECKNFIFTPDFFCKYYIINKIINIVEFLVYNKQILFIKNFALQFQKIVF